MNIYYSIQSHINKMFQKLNIETIIVICLLMLWTLFFSSMVAFFLGNLSKNLFLSLDIFFFFFVILYFFFETKVVKYLENREILKFYWANINNDTFENNAPLSKKELCTDKFDVLVRSFELSLIEITKVFTNLYSKNYLIIQKEYFEEHHFIKLIEIRPHIGWLYFDLTNDDSIDYFRQKKSSQLQSYILTQYQTVSQIVKIKNISKNVFLVDKENLWFNSPTRYPLNSYYVLWELCAGLNTMLNYQLENFVNTNPNPDKDSALTQWFNDINEIFNKFVKTNKDWISFYMNCKWDEDYTAFSKKEYNNLDTLVWRRIKNILDDITIDNINESLIDLPPLSTYLKYVFPFKSKELSISIKKAIINKIAQKNINTFKKMELIKQILWEYPIESLK